MVHRKFVSILKYLQILTAIFCGVLLTAEVIADNEMKKNKHCKQAWCLIFDFEVTQEISLVTLVELKTLFYR